MPARNYAQWVRLVLMSDTHIPKRAHDLPLELWAAVDEADVVVHAGDWVDVAMLDALEARAGRLVACYGNNDGPALRARLPELARVALDGLRLAVIHETGQTKGREARCAAEFPDVDVLVFGHSHIPWDTVAPGGLRLLNPGSPTDRRRQPYPTYMTATVEHGALTDVELHRLPRRGHQDQHEYKETGPSAHREGPVSRIKS
jgi:putative phosphoesterase